MNALRLPRVVFSPVRSARAIASKPHEKDPQLADYPQLPWISNQSLPPRGWWDTQERRNFGDPVSPRTSTVYRRLIITPLTDSRIRRGAFDVGSRYPPCVPSESPLPILARRLGLRRLWLPLQVRTRSRTSNRPSRIPILGSHT